MFLADIHIGVMDYDQTAKECLYIEQLLKEYTEDELLDFVVIGGDFFDKQLYGNDKFINLALRLMTRIIVSAKAVRVVYGTSSHDSDQYGIFEMIAKDVPIAMQNKEYNFKIITSVREEELLPGLEVLYIPEEYIFSKANYYKEFLQKKNHYSYIFGHGVIYEAFNGRIKKSEQDDMKRRKPPVFSSGELSHACKGDVLFGHYHIHTEMEGNVSYVGSFSRWEFGERVEEQTDKGFFQLFCDTETGEYKKEFVINEKARKYVTVVYGYKDSVFKSAEEMEKISERLIKRQEKHNIYKLRIVFNIPLGYENPEGLINFMTNRFKDYKNIQLTFNNGYVEQKKLSAKESISDVPEEYYVFLDRNVPEEEKLSLFLKMKRGVDMSPEKIRAYLGL